MIQQKTYKHAFTTLRDGAHPVSLVGKHALGVPGAYQT